MFSTQSPFLPLTRRLLQPLIAGLLVGAALPAAAQEVDPGGIPSEYNVVWKQPSKDASESMPCGGGDIGLNVWVENGDLLFYMQRSGSLAETNEYLKLGRVRLNLEPNPFAEGGIYFSQSLMLREGHVEIHGAQVRPDGSVFVVGIRIWAEIERPIIHAEVIASDEVQVRAIYENWRIEDQPMPHGDRRRSFFTLDQYPGEVTLSKDAIEHVEDGVMFFHHNPVDGTTVDLLVEQQGLGEYRDQIRDDLSNRTFGGMMTGEGFVAAGVTEGQYQDLEYRGWVMQSKVKAKNHHLRVVTHIDQAQTLDQWKSELRQAVIASARDYEAARIKALAWWAEFWDRSWIQINPENPDDQNAAWRVGRNYNLFRYQLGCNAFGKYPSKFNGGNFTFDANLVGARGRGLGPDWRDWGGGVFTAQNQRLLYWPLLKSGDVDAILPQLELYRKALPGALTRVKANFGHDGAVFSEYISVPGLALGAGYGWKSGGRLRGTEIPFGDARADANRGYNNLVEKGIMANPVISYHWTSQLEHAYMMLEYSRFTGADISRYMPFIENALIFFDEHYRLRQKMRNGVELDKDGKLVIFPSTSCETYRGATNPADVVSGLQACLLAMLELDDDVFSSRDKDYYRAFLNSIPALTFAESNGVRILHPAASWKSSQNMECPQFYPLFPFNRFDLMGDDGEHLQTFRDTWKHGTFAKGMVQSWHQDGIFFARMGLVEEAASYNRRKLDDSPRRFPTFWGPGHDWVPDHNWGGSGMIGLQEMVMHTVGDKILLLPAWPKTWDLDFKLHAPQQTTVEGRYRDGKLLEWSVTPESRRADVTVVGAND